MYRNIFYSLLLATKLITAENFLDEDFSSTGLTADTELSTTAIVINGFSYSYGGSNVSPYGATYFHTTDNMVAWGGSNSVLPSSPVVAPALGLRCDSTNRANAAYVEISLPNAYDVDDVIFHLDPLKSAKHRVGVSYKVGEVWTELTEVVRDGADAVERAGVYQHTFEVDTSNVTAVKIEFWNFNNYDTSTVLDNIQISGSVSNSNSTPSSPYVSTPSGSATTGKSHDVGYIFTPQEDIIITELAVADVAGSDGITVGHKVAIYNYAEQDPTKPLYSHTFSNHATGSGEMIGDFETFFEPVFLSLNKGETYYIISNTNDVAGSEDWVIISAATGSTPTGVDATDISYGGGVYFNNGTTYTENSSNDNMFYAANFSYVVSDIDSGAINDFTVRDQTATYLGTSSFSAGYKFTPTVDVRVESVGSIDADGNGGIKNGQILKIYKVSDNSIVLDYTYAGTALNSTIGTGSTGNNCRYEAINPVIMQAGEQYYIALDLSGEWWKNPTSDTVLEFGGEITYDGSCHSSGSLGSGDLSTLNLIDNTSKIYLGPVFNYTVYEPISISTPLADAIYQRDILTGQATITVNGQVDVASFDQVQVRLVSVAGGTSTSWQDATISGADFSLDITADSDWYSMEIKVFNSSVEVANYSSNVGIGDVFITAGQSNSANAGQGAQTAINPGVKTYDVAGISGYESGGYWQQTVDPQPDASISSVSNQGSPWPAFGDKVANELGIPVGLACVGEGSTSVGQWDATLYDSKMKPAIQALAATGFRAILWHQGEKDVNDNTTQAAYASSLQSIINKSRVDALTAGMTTDIEWGIAIAGDRPGTGDDAQVLVIEAAQQQVIDADNLVFRGAYTNDFEALGLTHTPSNSIHFSTAGLTEHGSRWYTSIYNNTPVVGIEVVQNGTELTWTVGDEIGVKEYQVVDVATGEVIAVVDATGLDTYAVTIPKGVNAKLVVVDNSGFTQNFYPENGDIRTVAYSLNEGWNLITVTTENADLTQLKKVTTGDFWIWNGDAYEVTTSPQPTQGVWVYANNATEVTVSGIKSDAEMTVNTGWNLVGPVENSNVPAEATLIYNWNEVYETIAIDQGVLLQGVGYWIFSF